MIIAMGSADFGALPDWVSAFGTASALFSGIWVFSRQQRQTNAQLTLARKEADERSFALASRQAAHITAWLDIQPMSLQPIDDREIRMQYQDLVADFNQVHRNHIAVLIRNDLRLPGSDHPLTEAEYMQLSDSRREAIEESFKEYSQFVEKYGILATSADVSSLTLCVSNTSDSPVFNLKASVTATLGHDLDSLSIDGDIAATEIPIVPPREGMPPKTAPIQTTGGKVIFTKGRYLLDRERANLQLIISFVDAANVTWKRDATGKLLPG